MIRGFKAGCDDYIAKPFSTELLNQRIMAVLRRTEQGINNDLFQYKDMSVDFDKMQVLVNNNLVKLSVTEYQTEPFLKDIKNLGLALSERQAEQLIRYYEMLVKWNQVMNLTAITEFGDVMKVL